MSSIRFHQTCAAAAGAGAVAAGVGWASTARRLHHRTRELRHARRDPATGLLTRAGWEITAPALLRRTDLCGMVDLDEFKHVNDTFGHSTGDRVLRAIATRLRAALPADALLARLGGDEFVFLAKLPVETLASAADTLLDGLTARLRIRGHAMHIGASIGLAVLTDLPTAQLREAVAAADDAMYDAKVFRTGWCRYDPDLHSTPPVRPVRSPSAPCVDDHGSVQVGTAP
ncbi:GGDEF domain-containing protein [Saccharopolyspora sp. SCSIO 74807]|uniref:GGDEF domain-containing protein n=1 Tax=Saccharopolyspora sp. SCSIO 74807 TaxID=3118084 RepID=UPI0030CAACE0